MIAKWDLVQNNIVHYTHKRFEQQQKNKHTRGCRKISGTNSDIK